MGIPYLNSDESILLSTHNILVDAAVSEAILTNRRLLIVESESPLSRNKDISFAAIETVTTMESGSDDPAISLAIRAKSGGTKPMQMVFSQQPRSTRTSERDVWAQKIKDQIALLPAGTSPESVDFDKDDAEDLKRLIGYKADGAPAATEDKNVPAASGPGRRASLSSRFHPPASAAANKKMLIATTAIVIIALMIAGAVFIYPAIMSPKTSEPLPLVTPVPTTEVPVTMVTTQEPTAEATPVPTAGPISIQTAIPEQPVIVSPTVVTPASTSSVGSGIWVHIVYDGEYAGTVGAAGRLREVSGTGGRYYQVSAAKTDIVEISIDKHDVTGLPLTIEVYNDGVMVKRTTITTPNGTLRMTVDLNMERTPVLTTAAP
jgi:hypothetical protein